AFGSGKAGPTALAGAESGPPPGGGFLPRAAKGGGNALWGKGGAPGAVLGVDHGGAVGNLVSSQLGTAASGGRACSKATAAAGIDGTACGATLQNTALSAGDYIQAV